jgi:peptide/nickel transport system ATP-binding protein
MIFQDPMNTSIRSCASTPQNDRGDPGAREGLGQGARDRARQALLKVGIPSPRSGSTPIRTSFRRHASARRYRHRPPPPPRGARRRRADDALDVTIQAQILAEVQSLCAETGTRCCGSPTTYR